jgi:glycerol-3-phosphate dehydrogenase
MRIHGWLKNYDVHDPLHYYGSDALGIHKLQHEDPKLEEPLHSGLPYTGAEVIWGVREEMARTVEDVLSRRMRALLLDARASIEMAPAVARLLATELGKTKKWQKEQVDVYASLAREYILE